MVSLTVMLILFFVPENVSASNVILQLCVFENKPCDILFLQLG